MFIIHSIALDNEIRHALSEPARWVAAYSQPAVSDAQALRPLGGFPPRLRARGGGSRTSDYGKSTHWRRPVGRDPPPCPRRPLFRKHQVALTGFSARSEAVIIS